MNLADNPLSLAAIRDAASRAAPFVMRTPVHEWRGREIAQRIGTNTTVVLKLELFQHTGTFKARGAVNVVGSLDAEARRRGVTAVSAGNHAIATAYAAQCFDCSAKVVMMASANAARRQRCKEYGAEVVIAKDGATAFAIAQELAEREGRHFVHPFEGPLVAQGTATLGMELMEQAPQLDAVVVPIGGGGLCAGVSTAVRLLSERCRVYGVEPEGADAMHRSFAAGGPLTGLQNTTIADSLAPPMTTPYAYELCRKNVHRLVRVSDSEIVDAMALLFREMKLAVEPAGAASTAALLGPLRTELQGKRVGLIVCGANIDIESFSAHVRGSIDRSGVL